MADKRTKAVDTSQLSASELEDLWAAIPERRRVAFLGSLSQEAADQLLAHQLRRAANKKPLVKEVELQEQGEPPDPQMDSQMTPQPTPQLPSRADVRAAEDASPAWPAGEPNEHWSDEQLAAYIANGDREIAVMSQADSEWIGQVGDELPLPTPPQRPHRKRGVVRVVG